VVSEVCARGYGTGKVGEGSASGEERLVGRSAAGAAVGGGESRGTTLDEAVTAILEAKRSSRTAGREKIGGVNVPVSDGVDGDWGPVSRIRTC